MYFNYKKYYLNVAVYLLFFPLFFVGCKKWVTVSPPITSLTQTNVYATDATAIAVLTGMYSLMGGSNVYSGSRGVSFYCGLSADELSLWSGQSDPYLLPAYQNELSIITNTGSQFWSPIYYYIYTCNAAIEGLNSLPANALSHSVQQQLLGEAKFMRAFHYFYLVNLFGDVPLVLTTNYSVNALLPRSSMVLVWQQIIADLKEAQTLLSTRFLNGTLDGYSTERVRPSAWAASALLARVYLYTANYTNAVAASGQLITRTDLFSLGSLDNVFLRVGLGNKEAIWQLQPIGEGPVNTVDGYYFIIPPSGFNSQQFFYLNNNLVNSFEPGDGRKSHWTNTYTDSISNTTFYYPFKYKLNNVGSTGTQEEYQMVLRLGEQYLIRAEAKANLGDIQGAQDDLNTIRTRAGLSPTTANDKASLLTAIAHERQVELFTESGHRWLDLKRTGMVDAVMGAGGATAAKGGHWNSFQQYYPLPKSELLADPNLTQNSGY